MTTAMMNVSSWLSETYQTSTADSNPESPTFEDPEGRYLLVMLNGVVRFIIGLIGLLSNTFLVVVVTRNKPLWSSTGVLLAALAVCEAIVGASSVVTLIYGLQGLYLIDLMTCFWAISPAIFAFINSPLLMLLIGVDRLLAVLFPFWYKQVNDESWILRRYIFALLTLSMLGSGTVFVFEMEAMISSEYGIGTAANNTRSTGGTTFKCSVDDVANGRGPENDVMFYVILATVFCYLLIVGLVLARKVPNQRQILLSLITIVAIVAVCWILSLVFRTYIVYTMFSAFTLAEFTDLTALALLTAISQSVNTFVLYACSSLFRQCMRAELRKWGLCLKANSGSPPLPPSHQNHSGVRRLPGGTVIDNNNNQVAPQRVRPQLVPIVTT